MYTASLVEKNFAGGCRMASTPFESDAVVEFAKTKGEKVKRYQEMTGKLNYIATVSSNSFRCLHTLKIQLLRN
jgi:hypothetical protein